MGVKGLFKAHKDLEVSETDTLQMEYLIKIVYYEHNFTPFHSQSQLWRN